MELTGSQIVIECLKEQGVDTVFGYPGGAILNIYDELYRHQDEIRHVLTSHEQGAAHAADGYARSTGRVGVCMATSGPGATNLVTGIATAYMDSVPMVAITCNVGISLLGKDSFQEIDIAGVTMPITKYSFIVKDVKDLAPTLRRAFDIARSGRPGPVLVDIVKSATSDRTEYEKVVPKLIARETDKIDEEIVENAIKIIRNARKPMILVGGGAVIADAEKELYDFTFSGCFFISSTSWKASIVSLFGIFLDTLNGKACSLIACFAAIVKNVVISNPKSLISSCNCAFKFSSILIVIFVFAIISLL